MGGLTGAMAIATNFGTLMDLSTEQLTDCSSTTNGNQGCDGGYMNFAYDYVQSQHGVCSDAAYPYTAGSTGVAGTCRVPAYSTSTVNTYCTNVASVSQTSAYDYVLDSNYNPSLSVFLDYLSVQPVPIGVYACTAMQNYAGGIFTTTCQGSPPTDINHAILATGFYTSPSDGVTQYVQAKNQWGTSWGASGYITIPAAIGNYNGGYGQISYLGMPVAPNYVSVASASVTHTPTVSPSRPASRSVTRSVSPSPVSPSVSPSVTRSPVSPSLTPSVSTSSSVSPSRTPSSSVAPTTSPSASPRPLVAVSVLLSASASASNSAAVASSPVVLAAMCADAAAAVNSAGTMPYLFASSNCFASPGIVNGTTVYWTVTVTVPASAASGVMTSLSAAGFYNTAAALTTVTASSSAPVTLVAVVTTSCADVTGTCPPPSASTPSPAISLAVIIGAAVGGAVFIALVVLLGVCAARSCARKSPATDGQTWVGAPSKPVVLPGAATATGAAAAPHGLGHSPPPVASAAVYPAAYPYAAAAPQGLGVYGDSGYPMAVPVAKYVPAPPAGPRASPRTSASVLAAPSSRGLGAAGRGFEDDSHLAMAYSMRGPVGMGMSQYRGAGAAGGSRAGGHASAPPPADWRQTSARRANSRTQVDDSDPSPT